jgi:hypothetical protein
LSINARPSQMCKTLVATVLVIQLKESNGSMNFEKVFNKSERVKNNGGFLLIRKLKPNISIQRLSDKEIISQLINSKFHHWRGEEEPNGLTIEMTSTDKFGKSKSWILSNHKFYGFFDNTKIYAENYKQISFDNFYNHIIKAIKNEIEYDEDFLENSERTLSDNLKPNFSYFHLDLDKDKNTDLIAEWQVYDFFYAYISIDRDNPSIYLIEFGFD